MSVAELKALAHRYIDQAESADLLEEIVRMLNNNKDGVEEPVMIYFTEERKREIEEADAEIERGEFYTHDDAMELLRTRAYRNL